MQLSNNRYENIKEEITSLFMEYDIKCIPINAFEIAIKMGLNIIPYSALSEEKEQSAIKISEDGFSIESRMVNGMYITMIAVSHMEELIKQLCMK